MNSDVVYLLHFDRRINPHHPARHYLGWTNNLKSRMLAHRQGKGARLTQVAKQRGITFTVARIWEGDRSLEFDLKCQKNSPRFCPICKQQRGSNHANYFSVR